MQQELTESVQQSIRPGEMVDTYYYGETNLDKQAYPCITNNRFVQTFTNLGAGSSQFVISPNMGVSDIVIQLTFPAIADTALALGTGWGYKLLNRVSVRYGSSAQYFFSGEQILLSNLYDAENGPKRDQILTLGGLQLNGVAMSGAQALLYLKLPHNSIRAAGKPLPFPSDLLVQPIVITVELFAPSAAVYVGTGGSLANVPAQLAAGQMQVKQEMLTDSSDLLARRVDMNENAYTFPLPYFQQQEVIVPCTAGSTTQSVNLTGFRAGEVRSILLWLTGGTAARTANGQPVNWSNLRNVVLTYNGEIFYRSDGESNQMWALTGDQKSASVQSGFFTVSATPAQTAQTVYWTEIPFAQINQAVERESNLMHGKPILNAVVNLQFDAPDGTNTYVLHAAYNYNASLLCSRGSAEYIF
jgi:hypothetical protein